jgi:hypothetical protein
MAQDWDIKLRGNACGSCSRAFEDNEVCFSALLFGENGYERRDYCLPCWEKREDGTKVVSTWQGHYQSPPPKPEEPLKHETAESLLRRLMEDNDESKVNVIFILAVMLERKKILVERHVEKHDGDRILRVYEHRKTGETFLIREPMLRLDQLEQVQTEVVTMLGGSGKERTRNAETGTQSAESGIVNAEAGAQEQGTPNSEGGTRGEEAEAAAAEPEDEELDEEEQAEEEDFDEEDEAEDEDDDSDDDDEDDEEEEEDES